MDYGEECGHSAEGHVTAGYQAKEKEWQAAWYDGECKDANRETTQWLKENIDKLTGAKSGCRILVPMCGAARDMHWLVEQGHEVIGVELVDKALQMFLKRHTIKHSVNDVPSIKDGKCYKSEDGKLSLYRCNIFDMDMSLVGKVDGVWDSGAMTDIPPAERIKYSEIILSALSPGGRILAETFTFGEKTGADGSAEHSHDLGHDHSHDGDHSHDHGQEHTDDDYDFPCRPVEMQDFEKMYGETCTIEMLIEQDSQQYGVEEWGPNWWAKDRLHLVIVQEKPQGVESGNKRKRAAPQRLPEEALETSKQAKEESRE